MKQFVKTLDRNSEAFEYLKEFFPKLYEAKIKAGIFIGPQITKIINTDRITQLLNTNDKQAWNSLKEVVNSFLGNNKADNYH